MLCANWSGHRVAQNRYGVATQEGSARYWRSRGLACALLPTKLKSLFRATLSSYQLARSAADRRMEAVAIEAASSRAGAAEALKQVAQPLGGH